MKRAVFLDRDGVINDHIRYVNRPEDLILFPFAGRAIARLNEAQFLVFVVTNQGGVGLGYMREEDLAEIHEKMVRELRKEGAYIDDILSCTHSPHAGCECRKPSPQMLLRLADRHGVDLAASYMVGDRATDVEAGRKAGTKTVLIGRRDPSLSVDYQASDLLDAVDWIVSRPDI
jgi:D-glycero-D-manno-heptose 1,7-bisphosphate phosphatase